jgi:hypothetical protein
MKEASISQLENGGWILKGEAWYLLCGAGLLAVLDELG